MLDPEDCSSSDESSSDEEQIPIDESEVQSYEDKILANPYDYTSHLALLQLLERGCDVERCRQVRERMSGIFPLTPELWINWIKQERLFLSLDKDRVIHTLKNLYSRAVKDYFSVRLWCQYCNDAVHILEYEEDDIRALFEEALSQVGLHVTQGSEIWDLYRGWEMALYESVQATLEHDTQDRDILQDMCNKQKVRVEGIFQRQLCVPLNGLECVMTEYKEWLREGQDIPVSFLDRYNNALKKRERLLSFEQALENTAPPHDEEYKYYIEYERKEGDPSRVICLMERYITDNPLNAPHWLDYLQYLDQVLKVKTVVLRTYEKAVRNIPWVVDTWSQYILAQHRYNLHFSHIEETLEEALKNGFTEASSYLTLWKTYLDCHWRRERFEPLKQNGSEHDERLENNPLNEAFQRAINFMNQQFGEEGDPQGELTVFMAECDGTRGDVSNCRQLMSGLFDSKIYKEQSGLWLKYVSMELRWGKVEDCRQIFQKAIQCNTDNPDKLLSEFLLFERINGTIESYDNAALKCRRQRKKLDEKRSKEADKQKKELKKEHKKEAQKKVEKSGQQKKRKLSTDGSKEPSKQQKTKTSTPKKEISTDVSSAEKQKSADSDKPIDKSRYEKTIFVSNLSYSATEEDLNNAFKNVGDIIDIRLVKSVNGNSRGFGYIEFHSREEVMAALELDRIKIMGRPCYVSECKEKEANAPAEFKFATKLEAHKLFVNNLPYTMTEDEIKAMFGKIEGLKSVRMVTTKSGKFKGFCYIEYETEISAKKAVLDLNDTEVGGRKMQVAISNPPKKGTETKTSTLPEKEDKTFQRKKKMTMFMIPRAISTPSTKPKPSTQESAGELCEKPKSLESKLDSGKRGA